jgi:tricorn protease-like protein
MAKFVDPMKYLEQFVLVSGSRLAVVSRGRRSPSRRGRGLWRNSAPKAEP